MPRGYWGALYAGSAICHHCSGWGDYTSDASVIGINECYTICDDGTRVYWPNTCTSGLCAMGAYMKDGVCTDCGNTFMCPGDNTRIVCNTTLLPNTPAPISIYTLMDGYSVIYYVGRDKHDCYCDWIRECNDASCSSYKSTTPCFIGPDNDIRLTHDKCSTGYYATGYSYESDAYNQCIPCTNLPDNAVFISYGTPDANHENGDNCPWECNDGLGRSAENTCLPLCTSGVTKLHVGNDVSIPLFQTKNTSPAIYIEYKNQICYADLTVGTKSGTLNVQKDGITYHTTKE